MGILRLKAENITINSSARLVIADTQNSNKKGAMTSSKMTLH
jgi:hypothetical protein